MSFFKVLFASILGLLIGTFLLVLILIVIAAGASGDKPIAVADNSVLVLDIAGKEISERTKPSPFEEYSGNPPQLGVQEIVRGIKAAKTDSRILGIYLPIGEFDAGMASLESIRNALLDFKTSKKFIYAYGEIMNEKSYYLASVADSVFLYHQGGLEWNGIQATPMFFKGLLDKLEVEPKIFRVGTFKSAVEPFILDKMSDANREQTLAFLNDFWKHVLKGISESRKLDPVVLSNLADSIKIQNPEDALSAGLVDGLRYEDEILDLLKKKTNASEKAKQISISKYTSSIKQGKSENKIAIIYAVGDINSGKGDDESIGSVTTVAAIRKAREDKDVKAIILRVNSPGGSALASDVINREILLTKKVKPIFASYGDVAASGGYYISANCDKIYAEPLTITGSIGVFGMLVNLEKAMKNKLGITFDRVTTNKYSDFANPFRPMSEFEAQVIQNGVNRTYSEFIQVVKQGRNFPDSAAVDKIAQGRVWSGITAKTIGLV
ncbi:MAG: signal peptide peptidase SppA, partial [Bacteroidia bacterium]|nr:signal peptide peptidase SppA [Bacteroidia bacterium]